MFAHLDIIMVASINKNTLSFLTDNCDGLLLTGGADIDPNYYHEICTLKQKKN